eukprot:36267-Pyramimonas_sp.AAC.1
MQNGPGPPRARRPWPLAHGTFCSTECAPIAARTMHFPIQNGPGPPRARRPWPLAHGICSYTEWALGSRTLYAFPYTERARAAARARLPWPLEH